jgi:hypothetical protein
MEEVQGQKKVKGEKEEEEVGKWEQYHWPVLGKRELRVSQGD